jgi:hypothetical protein
MRTYPNGFALLGLVALVSSASHADVYTIQIENLVPGGPETGQPMTPAVGVVHGPGYSLWMPGGMATDGLTLQAEDGDPSLLVAEAMASPHVSFVGVGGGPFFDVDVFEVEGSPGDLFSLSTMLARSNDIITGVYDVELPAMEAVIMTEAWDAGTEENTGLIEHIPFYGNPFVGPDEKNPIAVISAYSVVNDPDHGQIDFSFPPVARITISRMVSTPTQEATWGGIKDLYSR